MIPLSMACEWLPGHDNTAPKHKRQALYPCQVRRKNYDTGHNLKKLIFA